MAHVWLQVHQPRAGAVWARSAVQPTSFHSLDSIIHPRIERVAQDARVKELLQVLQAVEVALPSDAEEQAEC